MCTDEEEDWKERNKNILCLCAPTENRSGKRASSRNAVRRFIDSSSSSGRWMYLAPFSTLLHAQARARARSNCAPLFPVTIKTAISRARFVPVANLILRPLDYSKLSLTCFGLNPRRASTRVKRAN